MRRNDGLAESEPVIVRRIENHVGGDDQCEALALYRAPGAAGKHVTLAADSLPAAARDVSHVG